VAVKLEVCVDSVDGLLAAAGAGADRIELCSALEVGGLTPSAGQMARAAALEVPVHALIRSRAGDFCFLPDEVAAMVTDIRAARGAGLAGVVIGAATPDGRLDRDALARMRDAAGPLSVTLHRVFDLMEDKARALEAARTLGVARILTSGGAASAAQGAATLAALVRQSAGCIGILAAGGIRAANARALVEATGVDEVHASCGRAASATAAELAFGFAPADQRATDAAAVGALRSALDRA